jgi:polysaccharide biosynthesis/export protein
MPYPRLRQKRPMRHGWRVHLVVMLMACGGSLAGCANSSSNTASGGYNSAGVYDQNAVSASDAQGFAPTGPVVHSAAASEAADKLTSVAKPGSAAYKIGPLDVLDISVFKVPDLAKEVQVAEVGTINYPLIGDVQAAGRTAHDLERDLTQKLGAKFLRDPQVTVLIKEYNSQRVTVSGSVKSSGVYGIKGNTSLMQVIAMAGDIDMTMDSGDVVVFRTIDGRRTAAKFDIDAIRAGKSEDPQVEPGDVVVVDTSTTKVVLHNVLTALPLATAGVAFSGL